MIEDSVLKIKDGELKLHFGMWASQVYSDMMKPFAEKLKSLQKKEETEGFSALEISNELAQISIDKVVAVIVAGVENARILDGNFESLKDEYADTKKEKNKLKKVVCMWISQANEQDPMQVQNLIDKFQKLNDTGEIKAEATPQKKTSRGKK